ncbi:MAG: YHS domain-containing protein [Armatimonadota bacterium]|jgi:hypothetical protein
MRKLMLPAVLIAALAAVTAGCGKQSAEAPPPPPAPTQDMSSVPDDAVDQYCRVCYVDGGHKMGGYLPERLNVTYEGKTYAFCSDDCRKKFDENPAKYAVKPDGSSGKKDEHAGHDH